MLIEAILLVVLGLLLFLFSSVFCTWENSGAHYVLLICGCWFIVFSCHFFILTGNGSPTGLNRLNPRITYRTLSQTQTTTDACAWVILKNATGEGKVIVVSVKNYFSLIPSYVKRGTNAEGEIILVPVLFEEPPLQQKTKK